MMLTFSCGQVMDLVQKRSTEVDHIIVDTPGQIEVFTWSASGAIITETLVRIYPRLIALKNCCEMTSGFSHMKTGETGSAI